MGHHRIDKHAAAHLLEALQESLRHVGVVRMGSTVDFDRDLTQLYGRIRRLVAVLEKASGVPTDPFEMEFGEDDQNLVVSCLLHRIGALETEPRTLESVRDGSASARTQGIATLSEWVLRLATRSIQQLPKPCTPRPKSVRDLCSAVDAALGTAQEINLAFGGNTVDFGRKAAAPSAQSATRAAAASEAGAAKPASPSAEGPLRLPGDAIDPRRLRDPRLRSAATLDLAAWNAAVARRDHRMAAVHLLSLFEACIWDHAMPRAQALGLIGEPGEWRLPVLVATLCPGFGPREASRLTLLQRSVHFVHPARQLAEPMVITPAILRELVDFVVALLRSIQAPARLGPPAGA